MRSFIAIVGILSGFWRRGAVAAEENVLIRGAEDRDLQGVFGCSTARCGRSFADANAKCGTPCRKATEGDQNYRDIWCNQGCGESCYKDLDTTLGCCATSSKSPSPFNKCSPIRCGRTAAEAGSTCGMPCNEYDPNRPEDYVEVCPSGQNCFEKLEITAACCKSDCTPSPPPPPPPPACFSALATAEVKGKGPIAMNMLQIGDAVLTSDGSYSKVYSFSHYEQNTEYVFLQISAKGMRKPLEITRDHLLYVRDDKNNAEVVMLPAGSVQVGDLLITPAGRTATITWIDNVKRVGMFAPLTEKGDAVINGIVTSNYIALPHAFHRIISFEMQHRIEHAIVTPYRLYCGLIGGCENEAYDEESGLTKYVMMGLAVLRLGEWMLLNTTTVFAAAAAAMGYYCIASKKMVQHKKEVH